MQKAMLSEDVLLQDLGDESVLLHCDREEYYSLDEVGSRMLMVLLEAPTIEDALSVLLAEYEVDPEKLRQDLNNLIDQLKSNGLVEIITP
jgi:hypothetical protein